MSGISCRKWKNKNGTVSKSYQIRYADHSGKDIKKSGFKTKREAKEALAEIQYLMKSGQYVELDRSMTFREASEQYIELYASLNCKESTVKGYKGYLNNHILAEFGNAKLVDIKQAHVMAFIKKLVNKGRSPQTINHILVLMKAVYRKMIENEVVVKSPLQNIQKLKISKKEMQILTISEIYKVLDTAQVYYPKFYPILFSAIFTGMRQGELLALKWSNINWVKKQIYVNESYRKGILSNTKTENSIRYVDMSNELIKTLKEWRLECPHSEFNLVFPNNRGGYQDAGNLVKRKFEKILDKAKVEKIRWHDLRHTYASFMISQNVQIKYIQHQMGHSSIQVTMDRYGHLTPEVGKEAQKAVDALFEKDLEAKSKCS